MRVLLLVSDSRPAGKSGGLKLYSPGFTEVDDELAHAWIRAGLALDVRGDGDAAAVHALPGTTLCSQHAGGGVSCVLPAEHKGGRHYDFSGRGKKGEAVGAGWWNADEAVGAVVNLSPAALDAPKPCPTTGCDVGPLGHGGECKLPAKAAAAAGAIIPPPPASPDVASDARDANDAEHRKRERKGKA